MQLVLGLALVASSEAFFLKWGSDSASQPSAQNSWVQPLPQSYRYQYIYNPYESRKVYQMPRPDTRYQQPEMAQQNHASIPISVPAGASLTPVSLQHVQLVPCMCPVAPEEAEKLQEQVGPGPYLPQTHSQSAYTIPQQGADIPQNTNQQ